MKHPKYINRELSWLEFNSRVLEEAVSKSNPLLERLKFLAITASNLDEFFMVRVGGLALNAESDSELKGIAGMSADEQLKLIREKVLALNEQQADCFKSLMKLLSGEDIKRVRAADELSPDQHKFLRDFFVDEIVSTVAPVAVDQTGNLPLLTGTRLCVCVRMEDNPETQVMSGSDRETKQSEADLHGEEKNGLIKTSGNEPLDRFIVIPLGKSIQRIINVPGDQGYSFILLEDLIAMFIAELLAGQTIREITPFRLTRNADIALNEDDASDLLVGMRVMLAERKMTSCIRLEIADTASRRMLRYLEGVADVSGNSVYRSKGPIDYSAFFSLAGIPGFSKLKDEPWPPQPAPEFNDRSPFEVITESDRVIYHPYQSYDPVLDFIRAAAIDPAVIAIKQTMYRTARNSQVAGALVTAAENGKHVTAIVELKARFDEARNIAWARRLENAGVDVIYGVRGLKTHAKICIVVRREPNGIRRYLHIGTGNYNEATSRLYSDVSLFTCDDSLAIDAVHMFNAVAGLSVPQSLNKLVVAPINLRDTIVELIHIEAENARSGDPASITAKLNSLVDAEVIDALYEASQAGVQIRLNVRGICCLRPGVKGLSENIRVISVVDRMLEHARIMHFQHAGDNLLFIGSADWMGRNLDRRIELVVPVENDACRARILSILECYFRDNTKARQLRENGTYRNVKRSKGDTPFRAQEFLYNEACEIFAAQTNPRTTVFRPHRGETA